MPAWRRATFETVTAVEDFVCQLAANDLHAWWSESRATWDLTSGLRRREHRRQDHLTLLRTLREVGSALDELVDRYSYQAKKDGADFTEIGAASGVSRQAARQRHLRQTVRRPVTLIGGSWDGRPLNVLLGEGAVRLLSFDPWLEERPWIDERIEPLDDPVYVVYRRARDDSNIYRFERYENPDGTETTEPEHHLRIYRLADSWDIDFRLLLDFARRVDPRIRSEVSRLDQATADTVHALIEEVRQARGGGHLY